MFTWYFVYFKARRAFKRLALQKWSLLSLILILVLSGKSHLPYEPSFMISAADSLNCHSRVGLLTALAAAIQPELPRLHSIYWLLADCPKAQDCLNVKWKVSQSVLCAEFPWKAHVTKITLCVLWFHFLLDVVNCAGTWLSGRGQQPRGSGEWSPLSSGCWWVSATDRQADRHAQTRTHAHRNTHTHTHTHTVKHA